MKVCLFVSADLAAKVVLEESFGKLIKEIEYIAYMSRGRTGGSDACIKSFALDFGIKSCPFKCSSFEQLNGFQKLFDKCFVIRRNNDKTLERLACAMASVFRQVEVICYNPDVLAVVAAQQQQRKLSTIVEE